MDTPPVVDAHYVAPAGSRIWHWICVLFEIPAILVGPALLVASLFAPEWGVLLLAGLGTTLLVTPIGVTTLRGTLRNHRESALLRERGLHGEAEVLSVTPASVGEETGVELIVRVGLPGTEPWRGVLRCDEHPGLVPGARLPARAVPEARVFTLTSDLVRRPATWI